MTDPFFRPQTNENEYTHIINQQQEIEENFNKLKTLFSDPGLNEKQKQQIKDKLLELKKIYADNKIILQKANINIGTEKQSKEGQDTQVHVNKINAVEDNKNRGKINTNKILIGCGIIVLLLLGGIAFLFYYMITHPAALKNIGLAPANVKKLLQTFTTVFFGIITIVGFILFVMNIYRFFSSKKKSKFGYIWGILIGILFLGSGIVLGYTVLEKVNSISIDSILSNNNLIRPYLVIKDQKEYIGDKKIPIIGPTQFAFGLNTSLLQRQVLPKINGKVNSITLFCGNGQKLKKNINNDRFKGNCFYRNKSADGYPLQINIGYLDIKTSEQLYKNIDVGKFILGSNIVISNNKGNILNKGNEPEILAGIAGDTVTFDAGTVFKELGLDTYTISWDLNGDGNIDRENETKVTYRYTSAGVYNVGIRIPELGNYLYSFPLRIEQSDIPVGDLKYRSLGGNTYNFSIKFFDTTKTITNYVFQVIQKKNGKEKILEREEKNSNNFSYVFSTPGTYLVKVEFLTQDGKQGSLSSTPIIIEDRTTQLQVATFVKSYNETKFREINLESKEGQNDNIEIAEIPSTVQFQVDRTGLQARGYSLQAKEGERSLVFVDNLITLDIDSTNKRTISLIATDEKTKKIIHRDIDIKVNREGIVGKIIVKPDTVGTSPFAVKFDASTSQVNDPEDEIIYFTRDFGDGRIKKNISESVVEHIYNYDMKANSGEYHPKLKIKTRKGREYTIGEGTMILVKQPIEHLNIRIDSHPGQQAEIGDIIRLSLELDGLPTKIRWDFGNGTYQECRGRECVSTNKIYNSTGTFNIKVEVEYENRIPLEGDINLLIK